MYNFDQLAAFALRLPLRPLLSQDRSQPLALLCALEGSKMRMRSCKIADSAHAHLQPMHIQLW